MTTLNTEVITLISLENFKLDTLLPNYLILQQLHPSSTTDIFDTILNLTRTTFKSIIKLYIKSVKRDRIPKKNCIQAQIQQQISHDMKQWEHPQHIAVIIERELIIDSTILLFALSQVQDIYVAFLKYDFFYQLELINTYDDEVNLNWFSDYLLTEVKKYIKLSMGTSGGLMYDLIVEQLSETLLELVNFMNALLTTYYSDCRQYLTQAVNDFTTQSEKSQIMNKYLIIGLLHELSFRAYLIIENYLLYSIFVNTELEVRECFAHFIIFNHDCLTLIDENVTSLLRNKYKKITMQIEDLKDEIDNEHELENRAVEIILNEVIGTNMKIQLHHVINKQTQKMGIHIGATSDTLHRQFIVHIPQDRVILTNAKLVPQMWSFLKSSLNQNIKLLDEKLEWQYQSIQHVFHEEQFRDQMIHLRQNQQTGQKTQTATSASQGEMVYADVTHGGGLLMASAAGDIGSSLGYCLANINRYTCKRAFLKDFGTTAAINGSITYLFLNMPLVGKLVAIGGFGYFAMKIYNNQSASEGSKKAQLSKLLIGTGTGIGTSLGGALVGQALIPIPILGALVGGFIGGLVGGTSSAVIFEYMNEQKAKALIEVLEAIQDPLLGCWDLDQEVVDRLGLSPQFFMDQCPTNMRFDEQREMKWMNMVCYGFLCIYYTQKEEMQNLEQRKLHKNSSRSTSASQKSFNDLDEKSIHLADRDVDFEDDDDEDSDEEDHNRHDWPKSIDLSHKWLLKHEVIVLQGIGNLEVVLKNLISNL